MRQENILILTLLPPLEYNLRLLERLRKFLNSLSVFFVSSLNSENNSTLYIQAWQICLGSWSLSSICKYKKYIPTILNCYHSTLVFQVIKNNFQAFPRKRCKNRTVRSILETNYFLLPVPYVLQLANSILWCITYGQQIPLAIHNKPK